MALLLPSLAVAATIGGTRADPDDVPNGRPDLSRITVSYDEGSNAVTVDYRLHSVGTQPTRFRVGLSTTGSGGCATPPFEPDLDITGVVSGGTGTAEARLDPRTGSSARITGSVSGTADGLDFSARFNIPQVRSHPPRCVTRTFVHNALPVENGDTVDRWCLIEPGLECFDALPKAPTGLRAISEDGKVELDWNDSPDLRPGDFYQVYVNEKMVHDKVTRSHYVVRNLVNGQRHSFRVSAGRDGRYGTWTAAVYAMALTAQQRDADDDGAVASIDCDDTNAAVRPGSTDVNNGIDDDCDGTVDPDRDGDGALREPLGLDCNDENAGIKPGVREVAGNGVDENCDGADEEWRPLSTRYTAAWGIRGRRTTFKKLAFAQVERGTTIRIRCVGRRRCPVSYTRTFTRPVSAFSITKRMRGKYLRSGTKVELRLTAPDRIGRVVRWQVRPRRIPSSRTLCLPPGQTVPRAC